MLPETFDHACAAGCRALKPHAPVRLLAAGPPERWALRCLGCGEVRPHRLVHLRTAPGHTACGASDAGASAYASAVRCVGCLRAASRPLAMDLPETREPCNGGCARETPHAWSALLDARGQEVVVPHCLACGQRAGARRLRHLAYSTASTWCGLPNLQPVRRVVSDRSVTDCPECIASLLEAGVLSSPVPDWRPTEFVAEDFYAG